MEAIKGKKHARLGPSGWDWWSNCPGAPAFTDGMVNNVSRYAAWGSVAHEISDWVLREDLGEARDVIGQTFQSDGFDIEVDEDMVECIDEYVAFVRDEVGDGILLSEQSVPIGHLTGEEGAEGTSDAIIIDGKRMKVIDLKTGQGVRVNAEGNGQGRMYALGALQKFGMIYDDIEEVEIIIAQPRLSEGFTRELLNIGELEEFKDQVEIAAGRVALNDQHLLDNSNHLTDGGELELVPGEKQCKFCPGAPTCPALRAVMSTSLAPLTECSPEDFADLSLPKQASAVSLKPDASNDKLSEFLRAVPLIEAAITAVRAEVERRLFEGQEIPGFYLGVGRKGNRKWATEIPGDDGEMKPVDIENELKKRLGSAAYEKKLIGVPDAEKAFKSKPKTWAKIKDLIVQADGKPSVCREGDKNPPYVPVSAADFADLSAETEAQRLLS